MNTLVGADRNPASRVIVISDLHLGGSSPYMMSRPDLLATFLEGLPTKLQKDEVLELVIAGDFIDFLAIPEHSSWTEDPSAAKTKLENTMEELPFSVVFKALEKLVKADAQITILVGNHDVELALPLVQETLTKRLGGFQRRHQVVFIDDGRAYRIGQALIEHGNRYDGANVNDWTNLRTIMSARSRGEKPPVQLKVSAGSVIVEKIINVIKPHYPFIDLLQPQGELVALLLMAFEPNLIWQIDDLARLLRGRQLEGANRRGIQPGNTRNVADRPIDEEDKEDEELRDAFGMVYDKLRHPTSQVGFGDLLSIAFASSRDSLAQIFARKESVPAGRLKQIRVVMRRLLLDDRSACSDGPTEQYGAAAERIISQSGGKIVTVVMGHTHQARSIGDPMRARYINTGSWADVVRVPREALDEDLAVEPFLRDLQAGNLREQRHTYADLRIESDGRVSVAKLESAAP